MLPRKTKMNSKQQEYWMKRRKAEWVEITTMGKRFVTENNSGFIWKGKKHYDFIKGRTITGPDYVENSCTCIPWETCEIECEAKQLPAEQHLKSIINAPL